MPHSRSTERTSPNAPATTTGSRSQYGQRPSGGAEQEETSGLGAFNSVEEVAKKTKYVRLRAHLLDSTVLPALTYASETWAIRKQDEHAIDSTVLPALTYASETWAIRKQDEHAIVACAWNRQDDARSDTTHASERRPPEFRASPRNVL
ncbi:unnamed protein product [Heligmosomoides polygyrus]|uniref:Reverse transcriptase n=1 Tax=Heligmosomoides polygyrus TaxID=6339 RepID=A0A183F3Y1_HELPZ|nr:unnamed protein product [Heligmosomoides polygyrus]